MTFDHVACFKAYLGVPGRHGLPHRIACQTRARLAAWETLSGAEGFETQIARLRPDLNGLTDLTTPTRLGRRNDLRMADMPSDGDPHCDR